MSRLCPLSDGKAYSRSGRLSAGFFERLSQELPGRNPRSGCMRPKGSAKILEARRRRAAGLLAKGRGIREVARTIGAAPSSVKRWKDALEQGGKNALKSKPHTGRPPRLSPTQHQHLLHILNKVHARRTCVRTNGPVAVSEQ